MKKIPSNTSKELTEFRDKQNSVLREYINEKNYEMSFLVRWAILEKVVKTIARENRRITLVESLNNWLSYIEKGTEKPNKAPQTSIDPKTLPNRQEFHDCLNAFGFNGKEIWNIMDSNGRYRRHRNELAHTGKKFGNHLQYTVMCSNMDKLINKIYKDII